MVLFFASLGYRWNSVSLSLTDEKPFNEPLRIFVDDIKMNHIMLKRRFKKKLHLAAKLSRLTGEDAILICGKSSFDVIVMDQFMGRIRWYPSWHWCHHSVPTHTEGIYSNCLGNDLATKFIRAGADTVWSNLCHRMSKWSDNFAIFCTSEIKRNPTKAIEKT